MLTSLSPWSRALADNWSMSRPASIRPATPEDAGEICRIYGDVVEKSSVSFEEVPPDRTEMSRRMLSHPRLPWLVACVGDVVAGYAYASRHRERAGYRWSAECSVYVDASFRAQGVGRRIYEALTDEVKALGYVSLFAGIALPNAASTRLHASMGFEAVGIFCAVGYKHGRWHDVAWVRRQLIEPPVPPLEPRVWDPTTMALEDSRHAAPASSATSAHDAPDRR